MKPADFEYHAPKSLDEALALLATHRDDGKLLAGGQSLVPVMNFRLARPAHLIDLNGIAELDYLREDKGVLRIGALTRHAAFHRPALAGPTGELLRQVVQHIAHYPIRMRGTFVGSIAHADPASEWCVVVRLLEAEIVARSQRGERRLKAADYFHGTFATALEIDEVLTEVRLPVLDRSWRVGFYEFSRRAGDFALAMTAVALKRAGQKISEARIAIGGVEDRPSRVAAAEALLVQGRSPADAAGAVASAVRPMEDIHADAAYRKDLVRATTERALAQALA
ncbi:MAG TPA: xanthine dehydrogenase family protein subunit M [Burkholderiales bacterium]|nr:xanthine dehydrogenase family protein subunit M [Burkholderiales bacterium]